MQTYRYFCCGEWRESDQTFDVLNPYNNEIYCKVHRACPQDIEDAIVAAEEAYYITSRYSVHDKTEILNNIIQGLKLRHDELAEVIAIEAGKSIKHAEAEVKRAIVTFTLAAEEIKRFSGEVMPLDILAANKGRFGIVKRFPIGPVSCITPFNFPLNLVAHKVAPAIAVGNPIILKPASYTPVSAIKLAEIIEDSGLVHGGFNVVTASAKDSAPLVEDDRIKKLSFTGSAEVGWDMKARCGKKKITLELGGNAAAVIDKDVDIKDTVKRCVSGAFAYQGQVCIHLQRIYIHEDIYDKFKEELVAETKKLVIGDQLERNTDIGPMIAESEALRVEEWVDEAKSLGANILTGGKREGNIYYPTLIDACPEMARVVSEEVFGPVAVIEKFSNKYDVLEKVNNSKYGLQAAVFSNDFKFIFDAFETIEAGGIVVNDVPTFRVDSQPYGGVKDSGFGREGIKFAMEEMTEIKILSIRKP